MTQFFRPKQAYGAVSAAVAQNASSEACDQRDLHRRITDKIGVSKGTTQYGQIRSLNTNERDLAIPDAVYSALVSAGVDFSDARYNSSSARGSYANTSEVPTHTNSGLRKQVIICVGDSITASDIGTGTFPEFLVLSNRLWAKGLGSLPFTTSAPASLPNSAPGAPELASTFKWAHEKSRLAINRGEDSGRLANQAGMTYTQGKNHTDNFAQLKGVVVATGQQLVVQIYAGTNDVKYADDNSNPGLWAVPSGTAGYTYAGGPNYFTDALIPFIALVRAEYPSAKIRLITPAARAHTGTLNGKFSEIAQYAVANKAALHIDQICDMRQLAPFDPRSANVTLNTTYYQSDEVHFTPTAVNFLDPYLEAANDAILGFTPNPSYSGWLA